MEQKDFTKYEEARILGARALQLSMNAPLLIDINKEDLEKINYDTIKLAEKEFRSDVLPITVKRPLPGKREEKLKKRKIEKKEEKESAEEIKQREKQAEEEAAAEKKEEQEIAKEGSEIMELSNPEDEQESTGSEEVKEQ